eukprot:CAMPEP_0119567416 /NCGR_PEP_ID=MMETSP1352-20130426/35854_1 /TAXON_ID=265584 /ORGANISM="Stauroneis constricta, Strain CCMP1120" /LENGTH=36 /DNA_ID= /DNA_START= /DNA_END= /DNA_ORIENTATION=
MTNSSATSEGAVSRYAIGPAESNALLVTLMLTLMFL